MQKKIVFAASFSEFHLKCDTSTTLNRGEKSVKISNDDTNAPESGINNAWQKGIC